jgi:hypothetical protein
MEILEVLESVITCDKYPNAVSDGFMIDYQAKLHNNLSLAHKLKSRVIGAETLRKLRVSESSCRRLNKISDIQRRKLGYDYKRLIYNDIVITTIQSKYMFYFQDKYPDCGFYTSAQKEHCVAVRYHSELVGAIMPLLFIF